MKKFYSTIMMLAMVVAALGVTACSSSSDDDVDEDSIVGVWEVVSVEINPSDGLISELQVGDKLYFYADGTYKDYAQEGRWILNGSSLTVIPNSDDIESAIVEVVKLTSKELVLKMVYNDRHNHITVTLEFKRLS